MPWTGPTFPSVTALPGRSWPVKRTVNWSAVKQDALSGKRVRYSLWTYPTYSYEIPFETLRTAAYAAGFSELQTLVGFINSVQGPAALFGYDDPNDDSVTAQGFGTGDGTTTAFQLVRAYGGFTEPVFLLNGNPSIYVNGTRKTLTTDYTISAYGVVTFTSAPAAAAALTWTGSFYWPCRFDDDAVAAITNFMQGLFSVGGVKFSTEKLP